MQFRCERSSLLKAITGASRAVAARAPMGPALTGVRFDLDGDTLTVTGSDLDMTIAMTTEVAGIESGSGLLPARLAHDVVRVLPEGSVGVTVGADEAEVSAGSTRFTLRVLPVDDWPILTAVDGSETTIGGEEFRNALGQVVGTTSTEDAVTTDAGALRDALGQVVRSASTDETRPLLTGVLMSSEEDGIRLVSTDSYRLSVRDLGGSNLLGERRQVLVPGRALKELRREIGDAEQVALRLSDTQAEFEVGPMRLTVRLIEGNFPNYKGLIPESHENKLLVAREELADAVRRVRLLAQDTTPIRLTMSAQQLELQATLQDVGSASEVMEADYQGAEMTIAFNPAYLTDGLEVITSEMVTLGTSDPLKPALMRPVDDDSFLYLLMPVRVS